MKLSANYDDFAEILSVNCDDFAEMMSPNYDDYAGKDNLSIYIENELQK